MKVGMIVEGVMVGIVQVQTARKVVARFQLIDCVGENMDIKLGFRQFMKLKIKLTTFGEVQL